MNKKLLLYLTIFLFFNKNAIAQTCNTVGGGVDANSGNDVKALYVFNNELMVGGDFGMVGGGAIPALGLAKWNGLGHNRQC